MRQYLYSTLYKYRYRLVLYKKRKKKKGKEFTSQKHLRAEGIKPAKIKIKILRTKITR